MTKCLKLERCMKKHFTAAGQRLREKRGGVGGGGVSQK